MKKTLALILVFLMTFTSAACSSNQDENNPGSTDDSVTNNGNSSSDDGVNNPDQSQSKLDDSAKSGDAKLPLGIPAGKTFDGSEIRILTPTAELGDSFINAMSGDLVNDALYNRDRAVEKLLDVTFKPIAYENNGPNAEKLQQSITAGVNEYDFMHLQASTYFANKPTYEKILLDVSDNANLTLSSSPWWNTEAINELSYNGKSIKYLIGDLSTSSISGASVIFYNKNLFNDLYHDAEKPYNDVIEGKWTIDKYSEYCAGAYSDSNGSTTVDESDFFGTMMNAWSLASFYNGFSDTRFYSRDENGYVKLDLDTDRVVVYAEKIYDLVWKNSGVYMVNDNKWHDKAINLFTQNKMLFDANFLMAVESSDMRNMENDYGILPFFKLDESQEDYRSDLNPSKTRWICIPITCADVDMTTTAIEALSYYSYYDVTPIYYEEALKSKYIRDTQSGAVIDIVRDSIKTDYLIGIYRSSIGQHFVNNVRDNNQDYISGWTRSVKVYKKSMEKAYADLDK